MATNLNTKIEFTNALSGEGELIFLQDLSTKDLLGIQVKSMMNFITLSHNKGIDLDERSYFHLDKKQVGYLIDFLKRMYNEMDDDKINLSLDCTKDKSEGYGLEK